MEDESRKKNKKSTKSQGKLWFSLLFFPKEYITGQQNGDRLASKRMR